MKFGLQIPPFTWPPAQPPSVQRWPMSRTADEAGFDSIWVMDPPRHASVNQADASRWQMAVVDPERRDAGGGKGSS